MPEAATEGSVSGVAVATAEAPALVQAATPAGDSAAPQRVPIKSNFELAALHEALEVVRQLDPPGIACRDLRECLLYQLRFHQRNLEQHRDGIHNGHTAEVITDAIHVVDQHLRALQLKQHKEISKALGRPIEAVQAAVLGDDIEPGAQPQVESVAEHDLGAERAEFVRRHRFHRAVGAHRHERRRVDAPVRELEHAAPGAAIAMREGEPHRSISMASP